MRTDIQTVRTTILTDTLPLEWSSLEIINVHVKVRTFLRLYFQISRDGQGHRLLSLEVWSCDREVSPPAILTTRAECLEDAEEGSGAAAIDLSSCPGASWHGDNLEM